MGLSMLRLAKARNRRLRLGVSVKKYVLRIMACMGLLLLLMVTMVMRIGERRRWHEARLGGRIRIGGGCEIWVRQRVCCRYPFSGVKLEKALEEVYRYTEINDVGRFRLSHCLPCGDAFGRTCEKGILG